MPPISSRSSSTTPTTWIEIHGDVLCQNYRTLQTIFHSSPMILVMKSDAYGVGLEVLMPVIAQLAVPILAVNDVEEMQNVRKLGYGGELLIVGGILAEHLDDVEDQVQVVIAHYSSLNYWLEMTHPPPIHLKVDTGMSRQGFYPDEMRGVCEQIRDKNRLDRVMGMMSHASNEVVDGCPYEVWAQQCASFVDLKRSLTIFELSAYYHLAASQAALMGREAHFDALRVGILVFGALPYAHSFSAAPLSYQKALAQLRCVVSWYAKVIQVKRLKKGCRVGYGGRYLCEEAETMAVVAVGYFHGYRLDSHHTGYMMAKGYRYPVIGQISMNLTALKVPDRAADLYEGDTVTVLGGGSRSSDLSSVEDESTHISLDEFSQFSGRSSYEILTSLHPSISRRLVDQDE